MCIEYWLPCEFLPTQTYQLLAHVVLRQQMSPQTILVGQMPKADFALEILEVEMVETPTYKSYGKWWCHVLAKLQIMVRHHLMYFKVSLRI